jgi:hypothetical protein
MEMDKTGKTKVSKTNIDQTKERRPQLKEKINRRTTLNFD